jgi:hypothetical protein
MSDNSNRVPVEDFIRVYMEVHKEGGGYQDAAKRLGMAVKTLYQRSYDLRKSLAEQGVEFPRLRSSQARGTMVDRAKAELEKFLSSKSPARQATKRPKDIVAEEPVIAEEEQDALDAIFE